MTWSCDQLCDAMVEQGMGLLKHDEDARRHLEGCNACQAFAKALADVDDALASLPPILPPDETVSRTIAGLRGTTGEDKAST